MSAPRRGTGTGTAERPPGEPLWRVTQSSAVDAVVEELFDPDRGRPVCLTSVASDTREPRVDVEALVERLGHDLDIVVLATPEVAWQLSQRVPADFRAYGGGTRLVWPRARVDDVAERHPLFVTNREADSPRTLARIERTLVRHGYFTPPPTAAPAAPTEAVDAANREGMPTGTEGASAGLAVDSAPPVPTQSAVRYEEQLAGLRRELDGAHEKNATLATDNAALRKQVHSLNDQVSGLEAKVYDRDVYTDPSQQLRHEIKMAWLHTYPEPERKQYPLAAFRFGAEFVESVNGLAGIGREKIVQCCIDVLTRRAWEINGRKTRRLRASGQSGAPYVVRESDAALAWHCNLQTGTACARRMLWWEAPDGSIELSRVVLHKDLSIA